MAAQEAESRSADAHMVFVLPQSFMHQAMRKWQWLSLTWGHDQLYLRSPEKRITGT
jgi:hypothetical protein